MSISQKELFFFGSRSGRGGLGRLRPKKLIKEEDEEVTHQVFTYFKLYAIFRCSGRCHNRLWGSAHGWSNDDDEGIRCIECGRIGDLVGDGVEDKMLTLDTYRCTKEGCNVAWQELHDGKRTPKQCDCKTMVSPEPFPQQRFGRYYTFKCVNIDCGKKPSWEDFSIEDQMTQRCCKCESRGDIVRVKKLEEQKKKKGVNDEERKLVDFDGHSEKLCDMCDFISKKHGGTCHRWKKIILGGGVTVVSLRS